MTTYDDATVQAAVAKLGPFRVAALLGQYPETDVYAAVETLTLFRHSLPNDVLRTLGNIYGCASAARFGELYEPVEFGPDFFAEHDTAKCEAEDDPAIDTPFDPDASFEEYMAHEAGD